MDNDSGDTSIYASGNSYLWASGIIGRYDNPLNVSINGGNLYLYGGSELRLISADIYGTVEPSDRVLAFYNVSPGLLLFNNGVMGGNIINEYFRLSATLNMPDAFDMFNSDNPNPDNPNPYFYGFINWNMFGIKELPFTVIHCSSSSMHGILNNCGPVSGKKNK